MGRTGAREMFLATLDEKISDDVLNTLYEANIQLTTTKAIKQKSYSRNSRVLTFEDLVNICIDTSKQWEHYSFEADKIEQAIAIVNKQIKKHENHEFVKRSLMNRIMTYREKLIQAK